MMKEAKMGGFSLEDPDVETIMDLILKDIYITGSYFPDLLEGRCYHCNKKGHFKEDCYFLRDIQGVKCLICKKNEHISRT